MSLRFCVMAIGLFIVLVVTGAGGSMAMAQRGHGTQDPTAAPSMSMAVAANGPTDFRKLLVDQLHLRMYEVAAGDLLSCADDKSCLKFVQSIKSSLCVVAVCDGTDKSKEPVACFEGMSDQFSIKVLDQINQAVCSLIKSPSAETRRALLSIPGLGNDEDGSVESGAYQMALKGPAGSCQNYIKDYVGAYGPQWKSQWYRAMSGCRILTHERTRMQEEKDFYTWFGVAQGSSVCSDIINSEMRKACSAPGAASPAPLSVQPPGYAQ
mgnify:CR=1 FL=1